MNPHLPSLQALDAPDDRMLQSELRCLRVRQYAAGLRRLADELDVAAPSCMDAGMRTHLLEVIARLGCAILDTADDDPVQPRTPVSPASHPREIHSWGRL